MPVSGIATLLTATLTALAQHIKNSKLVSIADIKCPLQSSSFIMLSLYFILQPFELCLFPKVSVILQILFPLAKMLLPIIFFLPIYIHWIYTYISKPSSNVTFSLKLSIS